jgi:hypothetical protein
MHLMRSIRRVFMTMRMKNVMAVIVFVTLFSLLYVYQQTEIVRFAYAVQKKQALVEELLDKNTILRYNIEQNSSLVHIGDKISANKDFQMPSSYRFVRMANPAELTGMANQPLRKETLVARIFGVKRQAEAKTINP